MWWGSWRRETSFAQESRLSEAGITLDKIIRFCLPRGWFLPVTPGTKFPTLGGCIAADVHGKNHHAEGTIGKHSAMVRYMDYLVGRLVDTLDELGLRDNTYIFFTTDNGTSRGITGRMHGRDVPGGNGARERLGVWTGCRGAEQLADGDSADRQGC